MASKVRVLPSPPAFAREAREGCHAEAQRAKAGCGRELRLGKPRGDRQSGACPAGASWPIQSLVIPNDPKAVGIEPYILVVFESRGGAQIAGIVIEGSTAQYALAALRLDPRRSVGRGTLVIVAPAILDPLRGIPRHVVDPEGIGRKRSDIDRLLHGIAGAADTVGLVLVDGPSPGIGRRRAGSGDIFPFAFRGEAVGLAGLLREPREVALGVVPIQIRGRPPAAPEAAIVRLLLAAAFGQASVPLLERDFAPADIKRLADRDLMNRRL